MVWPADFRAYGQLAAQHVEEVKNPLRFQGQYFDDESGLHYNRHRYYCPKTGRFISPDPIGLAGGLNSYRYVVNPTGFVDPLGLVQGNGNCPGDGSADNPAGEPEFQRVSVEPEVPGNLGVVQSRINIAEGRTRFTPLRKSGHPVSAGFDEHVLGGHFYRELSWSRSIFSITPSDLKSILKNKSTILSPVTDMGDGHFSRVVDVGKTIGNAQLKDGGGVTSRIRILTDKAGNLVTVYPVK